ncbi:LysR substrate-binding domain-containing protein, partial [Acinetobacter baumannii]
MAEVPMRWIGAAGQPLARDDAIPLIAFESPCRFRETATAALDRAGIPWRLAFTSPNLSGLWAATAAGLGVTIRTGLGLPPTL